MTSTTYFVTAVLSHHLCPPFWVYPNALNGGKDCTDLKIEIYETERERETRGGGMGVGERGEDVAA